MVVIRAGADRLACKREAKESEQCDRNQECRDRRINLARIDDDAAEIEAVERVSGGNALRIRAEDQQQAVHHDDGDGDQKHELAVLGAIDERINDRALHQIAEREQNRRDRHQHDQRIEAKRREENDHEVHRDRHHLAVRKIDDPDDAENHRKAECHQAIDKARQYTADCDFQNDFGCHGLALCSNTPAAVSGRSNCYANAA